MGAGRSAAGGRVTSAQGSNVAYNRPRIACNRFRWTGDTDALGWAPQAENRAEFWVGICGSK